MVGLIGGVQVADVDLRPFIDRLSFPARVVAVLLIAVFVVALLLDFEIPSWEPFGSPTVD